MEQGPRRYAAFLSYSHKDAAAARALHRRLEAYRVPRRLVGSEGSRGPVPARLTPVFRDREELPAAGDLSETVRAALAVSDALLILCSPAAAASPWVAKEIETFRALHPGRPIIAAILDGEPSEAFPPLLCADGTEPLAADLRPGRDGRRLGFLKLVAGLSGVGLDALVQRDAQRRLRRVTAVTGVALAAVVAMAMLTAVALQARAEAQRQRAEAEGLVEFMLTDLRRELKGAAGLRVLTAANRRALAYYQHQPLADLPPDSLERRARIYHAMGEDDITRGDTAGAVARFEDAARTTSRLLAEKPLDQDRIFAQSQSEFWIADADLRRHQYARAREGFERYRRLVEQLVAAAPANAKWRQELGFSEGHLCTVELDSKGNLDVALRLCTRALLDMQYAARLSPSQDADVTIANRYGWLADVYRDRGDLVRARALRGIQERLLANVRRRDPDNLDLKESWLTSQFSMAELEAGTGQRAAAGTRLQRAQVMIEDMTRRDPANKDWASRRNRIMQDLRRFKIQATP